MYFFKLECNFLALLKKTQLIKMENTYIVKCNKKIELNKRLVEQKSVFWDIALKVAHIQKTDCPTIENSVHLILFSDFVYPESMILLNDRKGENEELDQLISYLNPKFNIRHFTVKKPNKETNDDGPAIKKSIGNLDYNYFLDQGKYLAIQESKQNNCLSFGCFEEDNIWFCKIVSIITNRKLADCLSSDKVKIKDNIESIHKQIDPLTIKDIVCSYGNDTLVVMIGAILESIKHQTVILIDNYPAAVALLIAQQIDEKAIEHCIFTNLSPYKCHHIIIDFFEKKSILKLDHKSNVGESASIAKIIIDGALQWFTNLKSTL